MPELPRTIALLGLLILAAPAVGAGEAREMRLLMGTPAEVVVRAEGDTTGALDAGFAALVRVDDALSLWKPSELSELNRRGSALVSVDLAAVLVRALDVARDSGRAFDPTLDPLTRLRRTGGDLRHLRACARRDLWRRTGLERVRFDPTARAVSLSPGAGLDLDGIAKGYAVDEALAAMRAAGATAGVVDLGGSSQGAFGGPVTVAVRDPRDARRSPWGTFVLTEAALGSSGDDQRPGHILDPRTGRPARAGVLGATVVATRAMEADALSTALFVLGDDGLDLLVRRGAEGFVLRHEKGHPLIVTTPSFAERHRLTAAAGVVVRTRP